MSKQKIRVVSAAVERDGKYLITQRTERALLPLMWEFPGGKVEAGEDDVAALVREVFYRVGATPVVGELISETEKEYAKYVVELHLYRCEFALSGPEPVAAHVHDLRWIASDEFSAYPFTPADENSMDQLLLADERSAGDSIQ